MISSIFHHHRLLLTSNRLNSASRRIIKNNNFGGISIRGYVNGVSKSTDAQKKKLQSSSRRIILSRNISDKKGIPNEERTDIVLTPGQKVAAGTRLTMYLGMGAAALTCLYFTARELIPTKMSPNTVFNKAHSIIQNNEDVKYRYGTPLKSYGKDNGGSREGRRNFIEHSEYTDQEDGSKRVRVRSNLEGPQGKAFVFAEVSSDMPSGDFVYLLVQDKRNGRVITVVDNRSMLAAKRMAGGSKAGEDAFSKLLSGGRSN